MAKNLPDLAQRSHRLADAAQQLLDSLDDPSIDRSLAIADVEHAAADAPASALAKGFEAAGETRRAPPVAETPDTVLSAALVELYSANVLISAGVALNEHGGGANRTFLSESVTQLESTAQPEVPRLGFEPASGVRSATLDAARTTFRSNAVGVLGDIVDEAAAVIGDIVKQLKKLDAAKVLQALEGLGTAIPVVASGGRLIKQGLEKLKNVINALAKLVGPELFAKMKDKVLAVWQKVQAGEYTRAVIATVVQQKEVEDRVAAAAHRDSVILEEYDGASNDVASLAGDYAGTMKLLRSLLNSVVTAGAVLALLPLAQPWLPAAVAGTYATLIAVVMVTAVSYAGSTEWVRRARNVAAVAEGLV